VAAMPTTPGRIDATLRCMRQQHKLVECATCGAMVENMTKHQR
jgi:hypothetical protein